MPLLITRECLRYYRSIVGTSVVPAILYRDTISSTGTGTDRYFLGGPIGTRYFVARYFDFLLTLIQCFSWNHSLRFSMHFSIFQLANLMITATFKQLHPPLHYAFYRGLNSCSEVMYYSGTEYRYRVPVPKWDEKLYLLPNTELKVLYRYRIPPVLIFSTETYSAW